MIKNKLFVKKEINGMYLWEEIKFNTVTFQHGVASIAEIRVNTMDPKSLSLVDGDEVVLVSRHIHKDYASKLRQMNAIVDLALEYENSSDMDSITKKGMGKLMMDLQEELDNHADIPRIIFEGEYFSKNIGEDISASNYFFSCIAKQSYYKRTKTSLFLNSGSRNGGKSSEESAADFKSSLSMIFTGYPILFNMSIDFLQCFSQGDDSIRNGFKNFLDMFKNFSNKNSGISEIKVPTLKINTPDNQKKYIELYSEYTAAKEQLDAAMKETSKLKDIAKEAAKKNSEVIFAKVKSSEEAVKNASIAVDKAQANLKSNTDFIAECNKKIASSTEQLKALTGTNKFETKLSNDATAIYMRTKEEIDLFLMKDKKIKNNFIFSDKISPNAVKKFSDYGLERFFSLDFNYNNNRIRAMLSGEMQRIFRNASSNDPDIFSVWKLILDMFSYDVVMFSRQEINKFVTSKILNIAKNKESRVVGTILESIPNISFEEYASPNNYKNKAMFLLKSVYDDYLPILANVTFSREVSYSSYFRNAYREYSRYLINFYANEIDSSIPLLSYYCMPNFVSNDGKISVNFPSSTIKVFKGQKIIGDFYKDGVADKKPTYFKARNSMEKLFAADKKPDVSFKNKNIDIEALKGITPLKVDMPVNDLIGFSGYKEDINDEKDVKEKKLNDNMNNMTSLLSQTAAHVFLNKMSDGIYGERNSSASSYFDPCKIPGLPGLSMVVDDNGVIHANYGKIVSVTHTLSPVDGSTEYQMIKVASELDEMFSIFETVAGDVNKRNSDFISMAKVSGHPDLNVLTKSMFGSKSEIEVLSKSKIKEVGEDEEVKEIDYTSINVNGLKEMLTTIERNTDFDTGVAIKFSFLPPVTDMTILAVFDIEGVI